MRITELVVNKRLAALALLLAALALGIYGLIGLPVDFLPDITYPMIKVNVWWRGATPDEIDKSIADPVERQMATVDGLDYLESRSIEGMYELLVNFKYGVNVDVAYQDALAAMSRATRQLPTDIDPPLVIKADPSQLPIVQMTISSDRWDLVKLRDWTENWLQDRMLTVPGVAGTEIVGGLKREIRVNLDPEALEKHHLPLTTVLKRLREENVETFGGRVTAGPREYIARTTGEFRNLDDIRNLVIVQNEQGTLYLRDIAKVEDSHEEIRVITRLNGKPCVKLSVLKQADANTVEVADGVTQLIDEIQSFLPPGVKLGVLESQAEYVRSALNGVVSTALEAAVLIIITVFLFLGSWRQVVVISLALPIILLINFGLMKLAGFSLNIFSLGGLVIAIGILLSNTIVVVENVTRWKSEKPGYKLTDLIIEATSEVGVPVLAATLAFVALFLPFLLVPGLTSLLFHELILVVAGVVVISLLISVTITPMLSSIFLKKQGTVGETTKFDRLFHRFSQNYSRMLANLLRRPSRPIALFALLLVAAFFSLSKLGSEFLPEMDDGRVMVKVVMPTGASVKETDQILRKVENLIASDSLIESSFTLSGGRVWGIVTYEIANEGEINIQLIPPGRRNISTMKYIENLRPQISKIQIPGGKVMVSKAKVKGIRKIGEADIEVEIKGQDVDRLFSLARQIMGTVNDQDHFTNVYISLDLTKPELQVNVDRLKAADLGISVASISEALRALVAGAVPTRYREGEEYYNLRVLVPEVQITSKQALENLPLSTSEGRFIRLRDVANVKSAGGPVEIIRRDQIKTVIVRMDAAGVSVGEALRELRAELRSLELPAGYELHYSGKAQMMADLQKAMIFIILGALFFAFVILTVQFNDLRLPGIILLGIPFALSGIVFGLLTSGLPQGATVIIGMLVVIGALANDGVLLLTFALDRMEREGADPLESVVEAARLRIRPILMTTAPLIVGLLPLALNLQSGGEMLQPMAAGAIGGLIMELMVALIFLPALFVVLFRKRMTHKL
jgi:hydrophobe/amphiphile efflux-1 (HAE1) family protein